MFTASRILLSFSLILFSGGTALAQVQDVYGAAGALDGRVAPPVYQGQIHDEFDPIYDAINRQAAENPVSSQKPVVDSHAYKQFMNQTMQNLEVEHSNTANATAARQRDAVMTGAYEQKKIDDAANWEKAQLQNQAILARRGHRLYTAPAGALNDPYNNPATAAQYRNIEAARRYSLQTSQDNVDDRLQASQNQAFLRDQAMNDVADSLRDQILSTQSSNKSFGLQGVGTNLYVRQYAPPDAKLPPVHNAAARIVPLGGADD